MWSSGLFAGLSVRELSTPPRCNVRDTARTGVQQVERSATRVARFVPGDDHARERAAKIFV